MLVALTKPDNPRYAEDTDSYFGKGDSIVNREYVSCEIGSKEMKTTDVTDGWKCTHCGNVNASCVGTCGCGCDKYWNMPVIRSEKHSRLIKDVQSKMLYCSSRGKQMKSEDRFCKYCGAKMG